MPRTSIIAIAAGIFATSCSLASAAESTAPAVTYTKDVAPIVFARCAECHRPGDIGPFSLLTYKDAAKRADFIKDITADRRMPPWKAEPDFGHFRDVRRLSDNELKTIAAWVDAGAPEGDAKDLPPAPKFVEGWHLGTPDLVLKMPKTFNVPAGGRDIYRNFVMPIPLDEDRTVAAIEFHPGNKRVVHHALLFLDSLGQARKKDGEDGQPGYATFGGIGILPSGGLGGWAPGVVPRKFPEGTGMFLAKGSDLVLQIHYHPDGKEETDQSEVGIYFTAKPARTIVAGIALRSRKIDIPAGESHHVVTAESQPLPADVKALAIFPHMHLLGREMKVVAEKPSGEKVPLIWIRDWDFNWQGAYAFEKAIDLPKDTVIKLEAVYDNSPGNPKNPSNPPQRVHWGEQTTDEMCLCGLSVITGSPADTRKIRAMNFGQLGAILGGGVFSDPKADEHAHEEIIKLVPSEGFRIPEKSLDKLSIFDKNNDGRLDREEVEAMPPIVRDRVLEGIREYRAKHEAEKNDKK